MRNEVFVIEVRDGDKWWPTWVRNSLKDAQLSLSPEKDFIYSEFVKNNRRIVRCARAEEISLV